MKIYSRWVLNHSTVSMRRKAARFERRAAGRRGPRPPVSIKKSKLQRLHFFARKNVVSVAFLEDLSAFTRMSAQELGAKFFILRKKSRILIYCYFCTFYGLFRARTATSIKKPKLDSLAESGVPDNFDRNEDLLLLFRPSLGNVFIFPTNSKRQSVRE